MKKRLSPIRFAALATALGLAWGLCAQAQDKHPMVSGAPKIPPPASPESSPVLTPQLSSWTGEVEKLARAGIEDTVILSYIDNTEGTFNLEADQIVHLRDAGVSSQVITWMLQHDAEVMSGMRSLTASTVPSSRPALKIILTPTGGSAVKAGKSTADSATVPVPAERDSTGGRDEEALTVSAPAIPESEFTPWKYSMTDNLAPGRVTELAQASQAPELKRAQYPVREPVPVELTAPILVFKGAWRTPNVLVIEFAP